MHTPCWTAILMFAAFGCSSTGTGGGGPGAGGTSNGGSAQACVDRINAFRATESKPPYARWVEQEACADDEARKDGESGVTHSAFPQCGELAQNECPGYDSIEEALGPCLDRMWAEGPGTDSETHGHYRNMSSTQYTLVACGFHTTSDGAVWAVQDFR